MERIIVILLIGFDGLTIGSLLSASSHTPRWQNYEAWQWKHVNYVPFAVKIVPDGIDLSVKNT